MNRKPLWLLTAIFLALLHQQAPAQQPKKVPRIGYLATDPGTPTRETFRQGLRDFGYVDSTKCKE